MMPLAFAHEGSLVKIVGVNAGKGLIRRLTELGLTPGVVLKVVKASGSGPVIVEIHSSIGALNNSCSLCSPSSLCSNCRIVLGFGLTMKILVQYLEGDGNAVSTTGKG